MRVLYLNPDRGIPVLGDKGASVHVREFITALAAQGHEVTLACANAGAGNAPPPAQMIELAPDADAAAADALARERVARDLPAEALDDRITRRELARLRYDRDFAARVGAALEARALRPQVIYERHALFHCAGADLARTLGVPRLLEVNAPLIEEQARFRGLALRAQAQMAEQASFRGADVIVAVSAQVADHVASTGVDRARILTLPNGVDTTRFHPDADGARIRRAWDLGAAPVIGFIGSFKPWHGVGFLIEAFAEIARHHPDARLLMIGEGPELENARTRVAALGLTGRAVFTGRVPHADIPACLAAMDLSAAPYLPQPDFYFSPLKVVESLAVGTPVIASRIGQLEQLVDDGATGALFTPGDRAEFTRKACDLLADPALCRAMGRRARARAERDFSWDHTVRLAMEAARRAIARRRAA